jgi:hypothetical protein
LPEVAEAAAAPAETQAAASGNSSSAEGRSVAGQPCSGVLQTVLPPVQNLAPPRPWFAQHCFLGIGEHFAMFITQPPQPCLQTLSNKQCIHSLLPCHSHANQT